MHPDHITDYISGVQLPDTGAEANRQAVEKALVERKGYQKSDIRVNIPLTIDIAGENYTSTVDLVAGIGTAAILAVKCVAGSLGACEREILAAARLVRNPPLPLAAVSNGPNIVVLDTATGKIIGRDWNDLPDRNAARKMLESHPPTPLTTHRTEKEKLIFRTYDSVYVNR
ncbi:MAG: hypothetical protein HKM93_06655 [Desulfobacteraceae bacterium]|nr:hypothetical protein [Desulfobacteraceae bacterium]